MITRMTLRLYLLAVFLAPLLAVSSSQTAQAAFALPLPCSPLHYAQMEAEFGMGTSALTTCLQVRTGIKVVAAWNTADINRGFNASKEAVSTVNIVDDYETNYGMKLGTNYEMVVIAYSAGGRWLLKDEAYNRIFGQTTGNITKTYVQKLLDKGIRVYMCQNVMRNNGIVTADLMPGVKMVPAGITGVIDFQKLGYTYISP